MKAQGSSEMVILMAITLIVLLVLMLSYSGVTASYQLQSDTTRATAALNDLANAVENVHSQATGAKLNIYIVLPPHINQTIISNKTIRLTLTRGTDVHEIAQAFSYNVVGNLDTTEGGHTVSVEAKDGYVEISPVQ